MNIFNYKKRKTWRPTVLIPMLLFITIFLFYFMDKGFSAAKEKFTVNSHDNTNFPLTGKHRTTPCSECHINGIIKNTPENCEACHWERKQDDRYNLRLGYHCSNCHTPFGWKKIINGSWNHFQETGFKREGIHKTLDCFSCHKKNFNSELQGDCISCHIKDYNNTRDPNHRDAGFPTTCDSCHFSSHYSWNQAIFAHNFPINSGKHNNFSCTDCHLSTNYREFSCTDCHEHDKASMDKEHDDESGYVYNSQNCYSCHPNGIAD